MAVALAFAPPNAVAATAPPGFVGLQSWEFPSDTRWNQLKVAKVGSFRAQLSWKAIEPKEPVGDCTSNTNPCKHVYDWRSADRLFSAAARRGIRVMPVLLGSPDWASSDNRWPPTSTNRNDRRAFYQFASAAVRRYGPHGTYWNGKSWGTSAVRALEWQIWNEPNLGNYWYGGRPDANDAKAYAEFLKATSTAARRADSAVKIVAAGLPWGDPRVSMMPPDYIKGMNTVSDIWSHISAVAIHPYARDPATVIEGVRAIRSTLYSTAVRRSDGSVDNRGRYRPIWLTEIGWSTSGPRSTFLVSESTQASYLKDLYTRLLSVKSSYRVNGAFWFNLMDIAPPSGTSDAWYYHTGLWRKNGTPKPSWNGLKCVTGAKTTGC